MVAISTLKANLGKTMTVGGQKFTFQFKDITDDGEYPVFAWISKDYIASFSTQLAEVTKTLKWNGFDLILNIQYTGGKSKFARVDDVFYKGTIKDFEEFKTVSKFMIKYAFARTGGKPMEIKPNSKGVPVRDKPVAITREKVFLK